MKIEDIRLMSDEELNVEIAQLCGWWPKIDARDLTCVCVIWHPKDTQAPIVNGNKNLPNYCKDLNAMYEAEKMLTGAQAGDYDCMLWVIIKRDWEKAGDNAAILSSWHSTARQKAEAFALTVLPETIQPIGHPQCELIKDMEKLKSQILESMQVPKELMGKTSR